MPLAALTTSWPTKPPKVAAMGLSSACGRPGKGRAHTHTHSSKAVASLAPRPRLAGYQCWWRAQPLWQHAQLTPGMSCSCPMLPATSCPPLSQPLQHLCGVGQLLDDRLRPLVNLHLEVVLFVCGCVRGGVGVGWGGGGAGSKPQDEGSEASRCQSSRQEAATRSSVLATRQRQCAESHITLTTEHRAHDVFWNPHPLLIPHPSRPCRCQS